MRAAGYVRVSTTGQAERGLSLEEQERRVLSHIDREGWEHEGLYVERGVSGRKESRPELDRLMERLDQIDVLVIPKLDRLGRSNHHLHAVFEKLEGASVTLVSLQESIDTSTPAGRLMRAVLAGLAEFESDLISERTAGVSAARLKAGRYHGGTPPFGYRIEPGQGLKPEPAEAVIVRRIFREAAEGASQREIARRLNAEGVASKKGKDWDQSRVGRVLRNSVHIGRLHVNGEEAPGLHEPLVDEPTWARVQALHDAAARQGGKGRGRRPKGPHLFTNGLMRCAHCGQAMTPRTEASGQETYKCSGRGKNGVESCPMAPVPREAVDHAVFVYFEHLGIDLDAARRDLTAQVEQRREEALALRADEERQIRALIAQRDRAKEHYLIGRIEPEEWRELRTEAEGELVAARARLEALSDRIENIDSIDAAGDAEGRVLHRLASLRRAIAGEIRSAEGLDAVRASLRALFERFDIGRTDVAADPDMPEAMLRARQAALEAAAGEDNIGVAPDWLVIPWPKAETIDPLNDEWTPRLTLSTSFAGDSSRITNSSAG